MNPGCRLLLVRNTSHSQPALCTVLPVHSLLTCLAQSRQSSLSQQHVSCTLDRQFSLFWQHVSCTLTSFLSPDSTSRVPSPVLSVLTAPLVHPHQFTLSWQPVSCTLAGLLCPDSLSRAPSQVYSVLTACHVHSHSVLSGYVLLHPHQVTLSWQYVSCTLTSSHCPDTIM